MFEEKLDEENNFLISVFTFAFARIVNPLSTLEADWKYKHHGDKRHRAGLALCVSLIVFLAHILSDES